MTTYTLSPTGIAKFFDNSGAPLAYGQLTTWEAGTTTPIATYSNYAGAINTNPIILSARGECSLWLLPNVAYKLSLTDANGNLISGYPVDQIINSQLLTLYGGVDFGSPNAYEITYSAPYTSYTAGNPVIYFIASNSNTGPSTINVNGLGIVPIVNPNGSPLTAGQIVNNQMVQIVWQNGQFILTSIGATTGLNIGTFGAEASIAAANVTDLGSTGSHTVNVTGSSVITSLGTSASINAPIFMVRFSGTNTLTYNATSLITPSGTSINVNTGDAMLAEYLGSGNWKILIYQGTLNTSQYVARTTQGTTTSSTAITIDTQLQLSLTATGTYIVQGWINDAGGTSSGGLSGGIYYSGSLLNGYWSSNGVGTSVTTVPLTAIGTAAEMQSAQTGVGSMPIIGMIQATSTGTLSFNWAQHSSNATASVVSPGSYLEATYVTNMAGGFIPVTYSFNTAGSFTFTIPTGATTLTLEAWGPSGAGSTAGGGGGGGGSGGYCKTIITVSGDGGETINYTVGILGTTSSAATNSTVTSGTFSLTTITAGAGGNASGSTAGAAGTATGGTTTNTAGNAGVAGGSGGTGGAPIFGTYGVGQPGGQGSPTPYPAFPGGNGLVVFHFA